MFRAAPETPVTLAFPVGDLAVDTSIRLGACQTI